MSGVAIWKATGVAGAHLSWLGTSKTWSTGESGDWQSHQDGLQPEESAPGDVEAKLLLTLKDLSLLKSQMDVENKLEISKFELTDVVEYVLM